MARFSFHVAHLILGDLAIEVLIQRIIHRTLNGVVRSCISLALTEGAASAKPA